VRGLAAVLIIAVLLQTSLAAEASDTQAQGNRELLKDTISHLYSVAAYLPQFLCFLPASCVLFLPSCIFFPCSMPAFCLCYLPVDLLNPLGYAFMLSLGALYSSLGHPMDGVEVIPMLCSSISADLISALTYPSMCVLCPILPCLGLLKAPCFTLSSLALLLISALVPSYYAKTFPAIVEKRKEISEKHEWMQSPFMSLIFFNLEHSPSCLVSPALWWPCLIPLHFAQSIALPLCLLASIPCLPVTLCSFILNFCLQLPSIIRTLQKSLAGLSEIMNLQNTCLPSYPGLMP